jgi:hypothetical protein
MDKNNIVVEECLIDVLSEISGFIEDYGYLLNDLESHIVITREPL